MLSNVMLGRYIHGESVIHRLDPRAKLLGIMLFFLIVFQARQVIDYVLLILFLGVLVKLSDMTYRQFWNGLRSMVWLIVISAIFQVFFIDSGVVLADAVLFKVTTDGLIQAVVVAIRFAIIIGVSTLLSVTTNPLLLADSVEKMLNPFQKIGIPAHEIALIFSIAMRFVPTILDETQTIMNAQRSRGVAFQEGNMMKRLKAIVPILVPLFASALRRADELANAMESRGYRGGDSRTKYRELYWQKKDTCAFIVLGVLGISIFLLV